VLHDPLESYDEPVLFQNSNVTRVLRG